MRCVQVCAFYIGYQLAPLAKASAVCGICHTLGAADANSTVAPRNANLKSWLLHGVMQNILHWLHSGTSSLECQSKTLTPPDHSHLNAH